MNTAWKTAVTLLVIIPALSPAPSSGAVSDFIYPELGIASSPLASGSGEVSNWDVYWNNEYGFQIRYPPNFDIAHVPNALVAAGAAVTFIPSFDPSIDCAGAKTNLMAFSVTVGVTGSSTARFERTRACLPVGPRHGLDRRHWQGAMFARCYSSEGAAGNRYETLSYLTDHGGRRYEIALFVHSGNPGCYASGAITIFDSASITRLFETMVGTFSPAG